MPQDKARRKDMLMREVRTTTITEQINVRFPTEGKFPEDLFNKGGHHAGSFVRRIKMMTMGEFRQRQIYRYLQFAR